MHTVYYTGEFKPVERSVRALDGVTDVWLRRNPHEIIDEDGNKIKMADEIYLCFPFDKTPSIEELKLNVDNYFEKDSMPETTMQDILTAINELTDIVLGGDLLG